jgi:hypothetical protein
VFFAKNSAPECSKAFFKSTKFGSFSSLTKKARPLKTAYNGSGLKKLRGCATVTIFVGQSYFFFVRLSALAKDILFCNFWLQRGLVRIANVYGFGRWLSF